MLVLTRKLGESIVINGNVVVTVTDVGGGQVRLGVSAPKEIPVHRSEIAEAAAAFKIRKPLTGNWGGRLTYLHKSR